MLKPSPPSQPLLFIVGGMALGMLSWLASLAVSGQFEPYDSDVGLLANQVVLCVPATFIALRYRPAALGAVTSLLLLILPTVLFLIITFVRRLRR